MQRKGQTVLSRPAKHVWPVIATMAFTAGLYAATVFAGLHVKNLSSNQYWASDYAKAAWAPPSEGALAHNVDSDAIRRGKLLFDETPLYAPSFVTAQVSCSGCHAEGGIQPFAAPMVGMSKLFPMYNRRAGRVISLQDRIQECFVRSENGRPLDPKGQTMMDLVRYIGWLSETQPGQHAFQGRGLLPLPAMKPDPQRGQAIYAFQCAGCHGQQGQGKLYMFPPVWGPESYNDGAGMNDLSKMAEFVHHNMPQNRMGTLSAQEAWDVSAFIHAQPRPAFNPAYAHF